MKKQITLVLNEQESNELVVLMSSSLKSGAIDLHNVSGFLKESIFEYCLTTSIPEAGFYPTNVEIEKRKSTLEGIRYKVNQKLKKEITIQELLALSDYISESVLNEFAHQKSSANSIRVTTIINRWLRAGRKGFLSQRQKDESSKQRFTAQKKS